MVRYLDHPEGEIGAYGSGVEGAGCKRSFPSPAAAQRPLPQAGEVKKFHFSRLRQKVASAARRMRDVIMGA